MDKKMKKVMALGLGGLVILGGGFALGTQLMPRTIETIKTVEITKNVPVEVIKEVVKEVPVEKLVTEVKEVPSPDTAKVMKFLEDNYDEDISVDYIVFENEARIDAEGFITNNFKSLLKDNDFFDDGEDLADYRTSEVSIKTISDAEIVDRDFKEKDLTLSYDVKFRAKVEGDDATYHNYTVTIPFVKGLMQEEDVSIELQ